MSLGLPLKIDLRCPVILTIKVWRILFQQLTLKSLYRLGKCLLTVTA
jgi:hypothetical protein